METKLTREAGDSQSNELNRLCQTLDDYIPKSVIASKNRAKTWMYGYNALYDVIVISKTGTIGQIVRIADLFIALPAAPERCFQRHQSPSEQFWERSPLPKELQKIKSIFQWKKKPTPFKERWIGYIEEEFRRREHGLWIMIKGKKTWIPPAHYMYLQWGKMDTGYPDYRWANWVFEIFWEACVVDNRCFGMAYVKIRRSGFSFMEASEGLNAGTLAKNQRIGLLSKTGRDAREMFVNKVVPMYNAYPFFFKPIQSGMDKPKTELVWSVPAYKITKKNMYLEEEEEETEGLDTVFDWRNTADNSYDSEKLLRLLHDESGKWEMPVSILGSWRVTKTCLRLGRKIIGKCMMGSTVNPLKKGGAGYKKMIEDSDVNKRSKNGQTKSGLYALFIPMEFNTEGFIDVYGFPVIQTPEKPILGVDGEYIAIGAVEWWNNEIDALRGDSDALNEHYRQFPRTLAHAFRDESKHSLFNLTKIYEQVEFNDSLITSHHLTKGKFAWENGIKDSKVLWIPDTNGRFLSSWLPPPHLQNRLVVKNGIKYPLNEYIGAFGLDSYDISGVVFGSGSKGSLSGLTKFHMEDCAPTNQFFLEYIARPDTAEIFFEDVLMALVFCGMPVLAENNKPRFLYYLKGRGYRGFSMNRPDKHFNQLSKTEREIGGIPNSSEDIIQAHAAAIESYIEKYVGYDSLGVYRDSEEIGYMPFNRTLLDWAAFDISDRTLHDASISSGLAIMANQKHLYLPKKEASKINLNFARYHNSGTISKLINEAKDQD